jgi:hypothetical protein
MPKDFGFVAHAPWSGGAFAPSNHAVLHSRSYLPPARLAATPLFGVLSATAIGGLTLIEPRNLGNGAKAAYRIATAALTGAYTAATLPLDIPIGTGQRSSIGVAAGGATMGLADQLEALDAAMVDWLTTRGVRRPRWWLAGAGATMVAAGWAADRAEQRSLQKALLKGADGDWDEEADLGPADPAVVAILDALLRPGVPGVEALRIQLDSVRQRNPGVPEGLPPDALEGLFATDAHLAVDGDAPRVVPRTQVWPVKARFTRNGASFEIELQIHEGRLASLSLMVADEMYGPDSDVDHDEAIGLLTAWPEVDELEFLTETADPLT